MTEATTLRKQGDVEFDYLGDFSHGGKQARTVYYLSPKWRLIIRTNKISAGGVSTVAMAVSVADKFETHRMYHDFNKTVVYDRNLRATGPNVAKQQASVDVKKLIEECLEHYRKKNETLD